MSLTYRSRSQTLTSDVKFLCESFGDPYYNQRCCSVELMFGVMIDIGPKVLFCPTLTHVCDLQAEVTDL